MMIWFLLVAETWAQVPGHVRSALEQNCVGCHSSSQSARKAFPLDERSRDDNYLAQLLYKNRGGLAATLEYGLMPPPYATKALSAEEDSALKAYLDSMKPPENVQAPAQGQCQTAQDTNSEALADLRTVAPGDRKYIRYVSLADQWYPNPNDKEIARQAVDKVLNSVSNKAALKRAKLIGAERNLMRIDLRDYGLEKSARNLDAALAPNDSARRRKDYSKVAALVGSKSPIFRADEFVDRVSRPPLYHNIQQMPSTVKGFREKYVGPVDSNSPYAAIKTSGVSSSSRGYSCQQGKFGVCCESYDFLGRRNGSDGGASLFANQGTRNADGGEFICTGENGLPKYFISASTNGRRQDIGSQKRINQAPTEVVRAHFTPGGIITNGQTCMACHHSGFLPSTNDLASNSPARKGSLNPLMTAQNAKIEGALKELGVTESIDPVQSVLSRYNQNLNADQLACELQTTKSNLAVEIRGDSSLSQGRGLLNNKKVSRKTANLLRANFTPERIVYPKSQPTRVPAERPGEGAR